VFVYLRLYNVMTKNVWEEYKPLDFDFSLTCGSVGSEDAWTGLTLNGYPVLSKSDLGAYLTKRETCTDLSATVVTKASLLDPEEMKNHLAKEVAKLRND